MQLLDKQEAMILKIIDWAQKHHKKLKELTLFDIKLAIRSK